MSGIKISTIQEQFWVLENVYPGNTAYNIPVLIKFDKIPDRKILEKTINKIVGRHEILRTNFYTENEEVHQKIAEKDSLNFIVSRTIIKESFTETHLHPEIKAEIHVAFDLAKWPLFKVKLFTFNDGISVLLVNFHHIIIDLHSKELFFKELSQFYNELQTKVVSSDIPDSIGYSDFSIWHNSWLQTVDAKEMISDWKSEFPTDPETLELPYDFPKPAFKTLEGKRKFYSFGEALSSEIRDFARSNSLNSFTVLLTSYAILLHRLSGQSGIVIGVPLTNRRNEQFREVLGSFVNIVPISIDFSDDPSGITVLKRVRMAMLKAHRKQEIPFVQLNNLLKNKYIKGNTAIFQAGFTFEPLMNVQFDGLNSEPVPIERDGSQLDLFFTFFENESGFNAYIEYSSQLFKESTAMHFADIFSTLTGEYIKNPSLRTSELSILTKKDIELLTRFNDTDHPFSENICLHEVLERQVLKTPNAPAILWNSSSMSYQNFNRHVNQLAHYLIDKAVKPGDIVAVCLERSAELMISIYAILKAGGVYLPIDPTYPADRLKMILDDAMPVFIIANRRSEKKLGGNFEKIFADNLLEQPFSTDENNPALTLKSDNSAYLIYTSGSTGKPKGVIIEHRSAVNKLEWMQREHPLQSEDTLMLKTPITFDVSIWELFWWIFNGAKLSILPTGGEKEPEIIIRNVEQHKVSCIIFVPSMFSSFTAYTRANHASSSLESLKWIIQIGEVLTPQQVMEFNRLRTKRFNPLMVNTYGPAEATVAVSYYNCPDEGDIDHIPIGKPISNTKLLVINTQRKLQPVGIPGELAITGTNLARAYLNRPELNSEKFILLEDPEGNCLRAYRTGDLVRWQADGNLEFIGRTDNQVKIRGHRIELGDIESALLEHPLISSAAVIVHGTALETKRLLAYVSSANGNPPSKDALKNFLAEKIPDQMIPNVITFLPQMPLNNSGKIDRKALPLPDVQINETIVPPVNSIETDLTTIWKEILNIEKVGTSTNFFDAGGNSLLAIRMVSRIKENLDIRLLALDVMQYPTIKQMAGFISSKKEVTSPLEQTDTLQQRQEHRRQGLLRMKNRR